MNAGSRKGLERGRPCRFGLVVGRRVGLMVGVLVVVVIVVMVVFTLF